jgi:hypothetical protein
LADCASNIVTFGTLPPGVTDESNGNLNFNGGLMTAGTTYTYNVIYKDRFGVSTTGVVTFKAIWAPIDGPYYNPEVRTDYIVTNYDTNSVNCTLK